MCKVIRFSKFVISDEQFEKFQLESIRNEILVNVYDKRPYLAIEYRGQNYLVLWGGGYNSGLPETGFCKIESFKKGKWSYLKPKKVLILASTACTNGIWYQVRLGIEGLLVKDKNKNPRVFVFTQSSTHYFKTMTGAERMPILRGQIL